MLRDKWSIRVQLPQLRELDKISKFDTARDTVILEFLYGAGLRVTELINLRSMDIDTFGVAKVLGKGKKERLSPVGQMAYKRYQEFIKRYLIESDSCIFRTEKGRSLDRHQVAYIMKKYLKSAGLPPGCRWKTMSMNAIYLKQNAM